MKEQFLGRCQGTAGQAILVGDSLMNLLAVDRNFAWRPNANANVITVC